MPATINLLPSRSQPSSAHSLLVLDVSNEEAEDLLDVFLDRVVDCFPFVLIQANEMAQHRRKEKPFLWKEITMATSNRNIIRQIALVKELMEELVTRLLLQSAKSVEVLQGLLIYTAWLASTFVLSGGAHQETCLSETGVSTR
jgi:hypothetical protein